MIVVASVLGIWGVAAGSGMEIPDPLPAWGLHDVDPEETPPEADPFWPIASLSGDSAAQEAGETPFAGRVPFAPGPKALLPPADEPEVSASEFAVARLRKIQDEPRFFPGLMHVVLLPATLASEGLGWLLLPHSITINGHTIFDRDASSEDLGSIFVRTFIEREIKFLAGLPSTYVATMNVELGLLEYDPSLFDRLQSRVIFDSLKKAYKERYRVPSLDLDTLISTLSTGEWIDFLVVPAVVSVYAARYGVDRKWQPCGDLRIQVHIEKAARMYKFATEKHGGEIGAVAINLFHLPVSFIVQTDRGARQFFDPMFVGIGTDLSVVVQGINAARYGE